MVSCTAAAVWVVPPEPLTAAAERTEGVPLAKVFADADAAAAVGEEKTFDGHPLKHLNYPSYLHGAPR